MLRKISNDSLEIITKLFLMPKLDILHVTHTVCAIIFSLVSTALKNSCLTISPKQSKIYIKLQKEPKQELGNYGKTLTGQIPEYLEASKKPTVLTAENLSL